MTALPEWMVSQPEGLTAEDYDALPEEISRRIEVIDGVPRLSPSPSWPHQVVGRHLANAVETAVGPGYIVATDFDLRLRDVPLLVRRPDIVVFDASVPGNGRPRPEHCLLVIELMSPGSVTTDRVDKPAEYATVGIQHYWRIEDVDEEDRTMTVFRYQLDPMTRTYAQVGIDTETLVVHNPVKLSIKLADLF